MEGKERKEGKGREEMERDGKERVGKAPHKTWNKGNIFSKT